uniref:Centrosomal protein of 76 kDa n=1 Tax=Geotrypetes seraphini TaxID=260995 RepID=A0A6P8Q4H0_GEOSA|nr:centrosomal protein of 76 kDa isoform X5 [Geotrypetes seraphini]
MSLPPEKASELKQMIHDQLCKMDVHGRIREVLAETLHEELGLESQHLSEEDLMKALRRRGIIDDVVKELNFLSGSDSPFVNSKEKEQELSNKKEMHHQEVTTTPKLPTHFVDREPRVLKRTNIDPSRRYLYLQVLGGKAFLEYLQEPEILPGQVCSTFNLCVHFRNQRFRSKPVPCACEPDFHDGFLLELHRDSLGDGCKMADATTMLSICDPVHMVLVRTDTSGDTTLVASYFLEWRSVLGSVNGTTNLAVELLGVGTECKVSVGILNIKLELYPQINQTLSQEVVRTQGDCEDHANLLCSLLLGYGLDAYVCIGTKAKDIPHAWVMTCSTDGTIIFWESLTGHRYIHKPINPDDPPLVEQPKPLYPYRTIGCVFSHQRFLGNCQPSDAVELCMFDLYDESKWKPMSEEAIKSVCSPGSTTSLPPCPSLCASMIDAAAVSNEIELQLRVLVSEHRKDLGLTTIWDDQLSYLLSPALAAYETERTTGISAGNEEFQDAIRRAVPDKHTFKGFPIHFLHRNARRAFVTCLRSSFCEEIICCRGDQMRLAVRVRAFPYPESACAVWIMFACKYRSVV